MKKNVIAYGILVTAIIILMIYNQSKSQTIDKLSADNQSLQQQVTNFQTQIDEIKGQLSKADETLKKQEQDLKTMNNVIAHNEQLRDEVKLLKDKLAKLQATKSKTPTKNNAKETAKPLVKKK